MKIREPWLYRGVWVIPVCVNSSGIRWCANCGVGMMLKSSTKDGMRSLIRQVSRKS